MSNILNTTMDKMTHGGFSKKDLRRICTQMGYDYENIPGETKNAFIMGLVLEAKRWGSEHLERLNQFLDDYEFRRSAPMNRISDTLRVTEEELLAKVDDLLRRAILSTEDVFEYNERTIRAQLAQACAATASALMQRLEIARGERD